MIYLILSQFYAAVIAPAPLFAELVNNILGGVLSNGLQFASASLSYMFSRFFWVIEPPFFGSLLALLWIGGVILPAQSGLYLSVGFPVVLPNFLMMLSILLIPFCVLSTFNFSVFALGASVLVICALTCLAIAYKADIGSIVFPEILEGGRISDAALRTSSCFHCFPFGPFEICGKAKGLAFRSVHEAELSHDLLYHTEGTE